MSFFDNLISDATRKLQEAQSDVQKYITQRVTEPLVKLGALPTGNLTAAQIASGMTGSTPPVAPPKAAPETIARSSGGGGFSLPENMSVPMIVGLGLVAFLIFKKRG